MFYFFDSTFLILIPAILLTIYAQFKVSSTIKKYSKVQNSANLTGYDVAKKILEQEGIHNMPIKKSKKKLGDHYNPIKKELSLSEDVYDKPSITALGIAAHEVGHAIQHHKKYSFLVLRTSFYPIASVSSYMGPILLIAGFFFAIPALITVGIVVFTASVVFTLVTLPVEFNASKRAVAKITNMGIVTTEEIGGVKKVLSAAALTYVAAALVAILQLIRLVLIFTGGRD